jgi:dTDP-L-rhamnose 4-epimerase
LWEILAHDRLRVQKVIVASSMSIYGEGACACSEHGLVFPPPRSESKLRNKDWELYCPFCERQVVPAPTPEEKPLAPTSPYAITERDQEELSLTLGRTYNIPTVALRFFNVFGSRQSLSNPYTGALAMFGTRLKHGQAPLVYEDGLQSRDFIHVSDLARVIVCAVDSPRGDGLALNVSVGQPHTILDVAQTLARVMNVEIAPELTGQFRAGDIRHCIADTTRLTATYGVTPHLSFEQGVREWWSWAERERADDRVPEANRELVRRQLVR